MSRTDRQDWFKDVVVYQIYTRSFKDSNGDGVGDFGGVIEKLDYLARLGVDVLWLSPFNSSPNDDNGYDVSDYRNIHPEFGDLALFDELVAGARKRNMKIMMDLVLNHSSDEHPWFQESRSSTSNPKRDWYIWAPPGDTPNTDDGTKYPVLPFERAGMGFGGRAQGPILYDEAGRRIETGFLPNNWDSYFGGKGWEFDPLTGEYYLHIFSKKQPDLNWANPELREEMASICEFWIDRGVEGFRLDAVHHIGKPAGLPDAPFVKTDPWHFCLYANTAQTHSYLRELNERVFHPRKVMTVGETGGTTAANTGEYVNESRRELDMIFHFEHMYSGNTRNPAWLSTHQAEWYEALHKEGWDAQFFSNHDSPRIVSNFGDDRWLRGKCAKAFAALTLTSWGTPYLYQGEEIGMPNAYFRTAQEYRDKHAMRHYKEGIAQGEDPELVMAEYSRRNRDNTRTPIQWSSDANGGFCATDVVPWIGVPDHAALINVAAEEAWKPKDPIVYGPGGTAGASGVLAWHRELIALRRGEPDLRRGTYELLNGGDKSVICYLRGSFLVMINLTELSSDFRVELEAASLSGWHLILGSYARDPEEMDSQGTGGRIGPAGMPVAADDDDGRQAGEKSPETPINRAYPSLGVRLDAGVELRPWEVRIYRKVGN